MRLVWTTVVIFILVVSFQNCQNSADPTRAPADDLKPDSTSGPADEKTSNFVAIETTTEDVTDEFPDEAIAEANASASAASLDNGITVHGNRIRYNGRKFISRGLIFEGFIEPVAQLRACLAQRLPANHLDYCSRHLATRAYYFGTGQFRGNDALTLGIRNWNLNSVRFNLNQNALDPDSEHYSPHYVEEIKEIVRRARIKNLVVFLALFDGRNTNGPEFLLNKNPINPIDTDTTQRAAVKLAHTFGDDTGVVLELLNEPFPPGTREISWIWWRDGGAITRPDSPWSNLKFVGVNSIIASIRRVGARNAIVIQGLGANFTGFRADLRHGINDPLNKIIYSVHPFFNEVEDINWWRNFGWVQKRYPMIITAWGIETSRDLPWCHRFGAKKALEFIQFLKDQEIGVIGYAMDVPYTSTVHFMEKFDRAARFDEESNCNTHRGSAGLPFKQLFTGTFPSPPVPDYGQNHPTRITVNETFTVKPNQQLVMNVRYFDPDIDPINTRVIWDDDQGKEPSIEATLGLQGRKATGYATAQFRHTYSRVGHYKAEVIAVDSKGARSRKEVDVYVRN